MDDDKKACNLTRCHSEDEEESFDDSTRSSSSELTQEWLDAARRMVASSSFEVDLESLMMEGKLSILVVGQDGEVASQCTILTDNYCEDAYDLLQTPVLKKLLQHRQKQILMPLAERTSSSWQSGLVLVNKDHKNVSL
ncbi:hypothetical protein OIU84_007095 [Salix udensis]|uniref:Uncharacterized protein n=1 Tax=Salix udensis TaxID=889485 RepID=A0AAD6NZ41_9ROSI|nr:hypothetical protein OIU84_007095 [Salix udensis]